MCMHCTRRQFLGAGAVGGMALAAGQLAADRDGSTAPSSAQQKVRICTVIAGKPADRSWALSDAEIDAVRKRLAEAEANLGNVEFIVGQASSAEETTRLLEQAGPDVPVLAVSADIFGLNS